MRRPVLSPQPDACAGREGGACAAGRGMHVSPAFALCSTRTQQ